tara:strand:+ start:1906 stop:2253 length:348 start_codon:yes stop_codon:yes gene_type:complete
MSNLKSLGEELLHLTSKSHKLDEAIHLLKSSENTLVDDVKALIEGAKLECVVDVKKIMHYLEEIDNYRYSAEDELSSCASYIDDAQSSIGYMQDEINRLKRYLEDLEWEKKEDKE